MPRKSRFNLKPLNTGNETIGERIARLRKKRGLTQQELAEKIGITQTVVTDYERGKLRLYDEMVARFAIALNVTTDQILLPKNANLTKEISSLRFMRRIRVIEKLPEHRKKAILKTLDDLIFAASKEKKK